MQLFSSNDETTETIWVPDRQVNNDYEINENELNEKVVDSCSVSGIFIKIYSKFLF